MTSDSADEDRNLSNNNEKDHNNAESTGVDTIVDTSTVPTMEVESESSAGNPSQSETVRETKGRSFFVGVEILDEIDDRYAQFNALYRLEYGETLPKNEVYYPALFRAIDWGAVANELGVDYEK